MTTMEQDFGPWQGGNCATQRRLTAEDEPIARRALAMMLTCRIFEEVCSDLRERGIVLGNTFPSLGQEAIGALGFALASADALFPSYRSRPAVFGREVTALEHFRELFGSPQAQLGGREVFHHAFWTEKRVMPASSMIGAWVPMAAGHALTQKIEAAPAVTVCLMGDGSFGAGDLHEGLNFVGIWRLPFVLVVENNGYQVSGKWSRMRACRSLDLHVAPYGFVTRQVDGNDAIDVIEAISWARASALEGKPAMLDCFTYRMGGYSSHLVEPRRGHEAEIEAWKARDPITSLRERLQAANLGSPAEYDALEASVRAEVATALGTVEAEIGAGGVTSA
jgi:TPP-dependent pyruvate/acetoin dehydrogenase alpha subunit